MLANAIGRVDLAVVGLEALRLPCPCCGKDCIRTFPMGDEVWGCRACARPAPEAQLAAFLAGAPRHG